MNNSQTKPQEVRPGMVLFLPRTGGIPEGSVIRQTLRRDESPWGHACIVLSVTNNYAEIVMITSWRSKEVGGISVNEKWVYDQRPRYCHISHHDTSRDWRTSWPAKARAPAGQYHSIVMRGPRGNTVTFAKPGSYANIGVPYLIEADLLEFDRGTAYQATIDEADTIFLSAASLRALDAPGRLRVPFPVWKERFLRDSNAARQHVTHHQRAEKEQTSVIWQENVNDYHHCHVEAASDAWGCYDTTWPDRRSMQGWAERL